MLKHLRSRYLSPGTLIIMAMLLCVQRGARAEDPSAPRTLERGKDFITVVREAEAGGYEAFPDIVRLADGRLMVAFYAGYQHVSLPNEVWPKGGRISYVTSSDEGATWSKPQVLIDTPEDDRDSSLVRLKDGRLACNFFKYPSGDVYVTYSSDNGGTWSEPQFIVKAFATSSPIRELQSGRLVLPLYRAVMLSDDKGKSWKFVEIPSATQEKTGTGLTETDVWERSPNELYAIHRADNGPPMHVTISTDGGETWGDTTKLGFTGHSPYLFSTSTGILLLGYRGVIGVEKGWDTRLCYSTDKGKTWSKHALVDDLVGAYPSLVELKDGSILIVYYEEGAGTDIRARRFKVDQCGIHWLTFGQGK